MRVVHINRSDVVGGASVAASRIVEALRAQNIDASMLVAEKSGDSSWAHPVAQSSINKTLLKSRFLWDVAGFMGHEKSRLTRFAFSLAAAGFDLSKLSLVQEADIIHLHWFNQGFLSLKGLGKLLQLGKPVVWTLHDMWGFTGGCHYSGECERFTGACGHCAAIRDPSANDISSIQHQRKKTIYRDAPLSIVTCSTWLESAARKSSLLKDHPVISIPNPIDIDLYAPFPRAEARKRLKLPIDKKILLFGAANISDPRKGMHLLMHALKKLANGKNAKDIELVIFGKMPSGIDTRLPFPSHLMNFVDDPNTLVDLYNAADVFVLPSLEDNLPNTVMEALSCGTPVAAFRIGGVPEMVSHLRCGFLAPEADATGLAEGIEYLLYKIDADEYRFLAREKVLHNFTPELIANRYIELYSSLLSDNSLYDAK